MVIRALRLEYRRSSTMRVPIEFRSQRLGLKQSRVDARTGCAPWDAGEIQT
jgi:hypothetical protein